MVSVRYSDIQDYVRVEAKFTQETQGLALVA
jgi:hypothetical protein